MRALPPARPCRRGIAVVAWCLGVVVVLGPALLGGASPVAYAWTLHVCPRGCPYTHIQDAIDHAAPGQPISIGAGIYTEALSITISLALEGGPGVTLDSPATAPAIAIGSQASVTIYGLDIRHGAASADAVGVDNAGTLSLGDVAVGGGRVAPGGQTYQTAGIENTGILTLFTAVITGNSGGAIANSGTMTVTDSVVSGNTSAGGDGGIGNSSTMAIISSTVSDNEGYYGNGGIGNHGRMTITASTISGNTTSFAPQAGAGGIGNTGALTLTNSTVSENGSSHGGGIVNTGTLSLYSSTVSRNEATGAGAAGGIDNAGPTPVVMADTILAGNTYHGYRAPDCVGTLASRGYNLLGSDESCSGLTNGVNGDQVGSPGRPLNPGLGSLRYYGGPTRTMALLAGSPAINTGNPAGCMDGQGARLTTDQRGRPRPAPAGGRCDIGAYELEPATH